MNVDDRVERRIEGANEDMATRPATGDLGRLEPSDDGIGAATTTSTPAARSPRP